MAAILNEYELSIWKDVWALPTLYDDNGNVVRVFEDSPEVLDEEKSAILSTDNFTFPGKAINIIFKTKINGTHELTFDLPGKYIDSTTGKKVKNYLRNLIDNETKVKLKYKDQWYSFYVKKVTEKRDKNILQYSYSCTDSFIVELSKTGYKITFNEYTDHYIEEIHTFANDILDGSEWDYDENKTRQNCDLVEYQEEKLVVYEIGDNGASVRKLKVNYVNNNGSEQSNVHYLYDTENTTLTLPAGTKVYGFYSEYDKDVIDIYGHGVNDTQHPGALIKQIIYIQEDKYEFSGNTIINKDCYYIIKAEDIKKDPNTNLIPLDFGDHYYGMRVCYNPYTEYSKELKRYVKRYTNFMAGSPSDVYSYTKSHIMVPEIATNYAANARDMTDTTGWAPQYAVDKLSVGKTSTGNWTRDENGVPILVSRSPDRYGIIAQNLTLQSNCSRIINTGPYGRNLVIDSPTVYALKIDYQWCMKKINYWTGEDNTKVYAVTEDYTTPVTTSAKVSIKICQPIVDNVADSYYKEIVTEASALDDAGNYSLDYDNPLFTINNIVNGQYYLLNFNNTKLSNKKELTNLFIVIEIGAPEDKQYCFAVNNLEFFEAWTYDGTHTQPRLGWVNEIGTFTNQQDIVPSCTIGWSEGQIGTYDIQNNSGISYEWMQNYISRLNQGDSTAYLSACEAYDRMEYQLEYWEQTHKGEYQYTLVTENSIVSGRSFDEELYFVIPFNQPQFGDPYVNYIDANDSINYKLEQWFNHYKYRTLKQEKSNRFNLTQKLSELYHVYPVYHIEYYPNGKIKKKLYDTSGNEVTINSPDDTIISYSKRLKTLYYTDQKGGENKYGFKYGHNLNSISRTIDSTDIVTKMFVTDNMNQYAKDGICTIARAQDNIGKDTYILRFDYFINRNLVSKERIDRDLYSEEIKDTYSFSDFISDNNNNKYLENLKNYSKYASDLGGYVPNHNNFNYSSKIPDVTLYYGFLKTIGIINTRYDEITEKQTRLQKYQLVVLEASVQTYTSALKALQEQLAKQKNLAAAYAQEEANKKWAEYVDSCMRIQSKIETYEIYLSSAQAMYEMYADLYNKYESEMQFLLWCKEKAERYFNVRYETLLREGVWQDSKYLDDNSYYLDAEKVAVDSCGPKITYNISVTDLSVLNKYKFTDFNVGDVTYVEDYEFFGDNPDTNEKYYQERTIVSAITCNLDNPSKNNISLQNYSTKFDDLFSRVTASVQSLTFNENIYQRAARFTPSGRIDEDTIQDTLDNEDLVIVGNQDVQIDGNGVLVTDLRIPSNKVKITGAGVFLTGNGGASWYGAFENGGINASLLTVGSINTGSITITNNNQSNFLWDSNGITAYAVTSKVPVQGDTTGLKYTISGSKYVRFNQYGLFFVTNGGTAMDAELEKLGPSASSSYIVDKADLAITYEGFSIRGAGKLVSFTSADGILMKNTEGEIVVQLGHIQGIPGIDDFWGLRAKGAYIEGKIYSEEVKYRTLTGTTESGTASANVIDERRSMLSGGDLQIWRNIIRDDPSKEQGAGTDISNYKITTMGSAVMSATFESSEENPNDNGFIVGNNIKLLGTHIALEGKCAFFSISSYEGESYKTKFLYTRNVDGGSGLEDDKFYMWSNLEFKGGAQLQTSSDARLKKDIQDIDERYLKLFDKLSLKTFRYNTETDNTPLHLGLIAQEVQQACEEVGLTQNDFGAVSPITADTFSNINYIELLTLSIAKIKQLEERIKQLEK